MKTLKSLLPLMVCFVIIGTTFSCKKSTTKPAVVTPPPANLVAHWELNGNANDVSRYRNNGTAIATVSVADRFGNPNSALQFDGVSSYIVVPDSVRLRLANTDFTFNVWVKLNANNLSSVSSIMSKRIAGANNGWLFGVNGDGNAGIGPLGSIYYGPGGGSNDAIGTKSVTLNQWVMVTCVYTLSAQTFQIYINGTLDNTSNAVSTTNSSITAPLYIGTDQISPGQQQYFLSGTLDDIRIYNTALAQSDISQLYTATN